MTELILYKKHFQVFIKGIDDPIEITQENGENLWKVLAHKDCPPFVQINWGFYNRFEIARVVPYEEHIPELLAGKPEEIKKQVLEKIKQRHLEKLPVNDIVIANIIEKIEAK